MTSQEMMKTSISNDQLFINVSKNGEPPNWQIQEKPADWDAAGNPNSEYYASKLFGYDEKEFLRKQYKD